MSKNLLMITGLGSAKDLAQGKKGAFYNTLEEFHKYWNRIDIIAPRIKNYELRITNLFDNVYIHTSPWPLILHPLFFIKKGISLNKQHHFGLMTVQDFPPFYNGVGAYILSFITHIPYVLEIMHIPGLPKSASLKEFVYKYFTRFFIGLDAHSARAVRVINQKQTRDFLIQAGISESKIKYIPAFYINLDIFKPSFVEKKYDIVCVGRLELNKGILNLLKAVKILRGIRSDLRVCIIGDGPLRKKLQRYIQSNRLETVVELTGWLKGPEDVASLLNQSRVFVNSSFNEGGPRVVLEAMACGVPVITTKVGLMLDIIDDGQNGLFVDWTADDTVYKMTNLLKNVEMQNKFREAGLELVKQFEKKSAIKNYADKLQSLI